MRGAGLAVAVVLATMVLADCSGTSHGTTKSGGRTTSVTSHLSYEQASAQVREYAQKSIGAFPAGASLTFREENSAACSNSDDPAPSTPVNVASYYWVDGLGTSGNEKYLDAFVSYWKAQGWKLKRDDRPGTHLVLMENAAGFDVILQLTADGSRASVTGSSPCVPPKQPDAPTS